MKLTRWTPHVSLGKHLQLRAEAGYIGAAERVDTNTWMVTLIPEAEVGIAPALLIPVAKGAAKVFRKVASNPEVQARIQQRLAQVRERFGRRNDELVRIRRPYAIGCAPEVGCASCGGRCGEQAQVSGTCRCKSQGGGQ